LIVNEGNNETETTMYLIQKLMANGFSVFWTGSQWTINARAAKRFQTKKLAEEHGKINCGTRWVTIKL